MSTQHFLIESGAPLTGAAPGLPPERWIQAFPEGRWSGWSGLLAALGPDDGVWVSAERPGWEQRVGDVWQRQPGARVIVVSAVPQEAEGLRALQAGARGYCHQVALPQVLRDVEQTVRLGGLWVGAELVQRLMSASRSALERSVATSREPDLSRLSEREAQVARLVAEGKSNKEVADRLFISERTVKAHLGAVFDKLGVRDRLQLVLRLSGQV